MVVIPWPTKSKTFSIRVAFEPKRRVFELWITPTGVPMPTHYQTRGTVREIVRDLTELQLATPAIETVVTNLTLGKTYEANNVALPAAALRTFGSYRSS